jgi:arginine exporter protein ArgO
MHSTVRPGTDRTRYAETAVQKVALVFGIVFLVIGIAGFIPGLTQNLETIQFAGHESEALLLGVFQVSILHNIVHLLYGIVGLAAAARFDASKYYLIWGGVVYALLFLYGLFISGDHPANFVPLNTADNWLHAFLAVAMIVLGLLLGRRVAGTSTDTTPGRTGTGTVR